MPKLPRGKPKGPEKRKRSIRSAREVYHDLEALRCDLHEVCQRFARLTGELVIAVEKDDIPF